MCPEEEEGGGGGGGVAWMIWKFITTIKRRNSMSQNGPEIKPRQWKKRSKYWKLISIYFKIGKLETKNQKVRNVHNHWMKRRILSRNGAGNQKLEI